MFFVFFEKDNGFCMSASNGSRNWLNVVTGKVASGNYLCEMLWPCQFIDRHYRCRNCDSYKR
jgi:hypothetical protein